MNEKGRQTKLLAAVAVFAMVVCALVAVMPSTDAASSATQQEGSIVSVAVGDTTTYYDSYSEAVTAVNQLTGTDAVTVTILGNFEVSLAGANSQAAALWFTYTGGAIIINGGGNTISVSDTSVQSNKNIIGFGSGVSAIVNDLVVDGEKFSYHGFNVYGATSLELNDVTSKNNSASGFTLNGSTVEMNNVIASGNGWGDVNIDQGTGLSTTPSVTISGADTSFGSPTQVWTELTTDSIVTFDTTAGTYVEYDWQKTSKISSGYGSIWFKDGTISMNYTVSAEDSLQIPADKTLNIADGVTFAVATDGKFTNNGIIYNEGTIPKTIDGTGVVIDATGTSAITEVAGNGVSNDTIQSIFEAGADEITVTGTAYITEAFDGTIVIDANGGIANTTQESPVVIGENSVLIIENCNGGDFYLSNGTSNENLVQLSGFHGEGMTITYGSITINGKNLSGTITVTGTSPVLNLSGATATGIDQGAALTINAVGGSTINIDKNMTVDGDVAITRGSGEGNVNVNLPSGVTATINGDLSLGEMVRMDSNGTLAGTGSITVNTGATLLYSVNNGVQIINNGGSVQIDDGRALGNTINENTTVSEYSYLTDDLVIPEGITLTVTGTGTLDLMSFNITVNGNLVIQRNGTVTSQNDNSAIRISATGSIQNSGIIGDNRLITVENATNPDQYVKLKGVSGVNISLVRETGGQDRNMVVSGDVRRIAGIVGQTLEVGDVTIDADMSIGSNVTFNVKGDVVVARNVAFTNNGTMNIGSGATFTLSNGASAVISGSTEGVIGANVGYVGPDNGNKLIDETVFSSIKFAGNERGVTLSVGRVSVPQTDGTSLMDQRLYINGSLSRVSTTNSTTASITVVGQVYVSDSLTVTQYVSVDMTADGAVFNIASAGTIIVEDSNGSTIKYIGAHYSVETTVDGVNAVTNYYTTFDNAYSAIATADEGTIYVSGKYTINGTYTIGPDQYIRVEADAGLTVASSAVVEVDEEGTIESDVFDKITGKVTVYAGVGYVPDSQTTYEVLSVNRETGDRTYSGFAIALSEANPGDTITIVAEATYNGNMVIPDQITVQVSDDVVLHVTGNATVETGGKLILGNGAKLDMGSSTRNNDVTVTVAGELDATEGGTITKATTGTVNLYSTGTTSMYSAINTSVIGVNSAMYYDGEYVYTSVANAIAYAEENGLTSVNVYGTFTESGDIDSMGVDILVYGKVTLGNVTLSDADIKIADSASGAYYTATVSGLNGEGDAAVQSTVSVSRTTATISSNVILNGEGVNVYTMYISEIDGATQFTAGTYTYNGDENITLSRESGNSVTVASGATFVIGSSINLYNSGFITNEGTIQVAEDVTLTIGTAILPGDVVIPEDAAMSVSDELTVTGTLTVEANGRLTVTGHIQVGETPRLSNATTSGDLVGNVLLDGDAYVLVYNGASVTDATIGNEAGSDLNTTTYVINGSSFATIITTGDVPLKTINEVVEGLRDLSIPLDDNDLPNTSADDIPIIVWYVGETAVSDTTSELDADVGEYPEVTTEIAYSGVTVTVSVGTGITLSIDGIIVTDMAAYAGQYLSIGTHTVSAVVNPGYAGDITIQFNGQTVTNGEIEITSDMLGQTNLVLSATGNITTTGGSGSSDITVNVPSQDDGMSLTDILLIVLVILILVMAIIVALRLMRS